MKKIFILLLFTSNIVHATVYRLNNNNPHPGQDTTWALVQSHCSVNDTVYVGGSNVSYGNITVSIAGLTIIGTGHNPQKQNPLVSIFGTINMQISTLHLIGIKCAEVTEFTSIGSVYLTVEYCNISQGLILGNHNYDTYCYLYNNIIGYNAFYNSSLSILTDNASLRGEIRNNIFNGNFALFDGTTLTGYMAECDVTNNIFYAVNFGIDKLFYYPVVYTAGSFNNNLIHGYSDDNISLGNTAISKNNLVYPSVAAFQLANETGTLNVDPLYINVPCLNAVCPFNYSYNYNLSASSPAKNAGTDGTAIGPYGGTYGANFNVYGEPLIPQMRQMTMPASGLSGLSFSVNVFSTVK